MKKLMLVVLLLSPSAYAWESPKNPDRFPSLGLAYTGMSDDGEYDVMGYKQDIKGASSSLVLDTRLPLSNSFTLGIGIGVTRADVEGEENLYYNGNKLESSGGLFTISGRYYFNR